ISEPTLVPAIRSIGMSFLSNSRKTPTCAQPRAIPPPSARPTRGRFLLFSVIGLPRLEIFFNALGALQGAFYLNPRKNTPSILHFVHFVMTAQSPSLRNGQSGGMV